MQLFLTIAMGHTSFCNLDSKHLVVKHPPYHRRSKPCAGTSWYAGTRRI